MWDKLERLACTQARLVRGEHKLVRLVWDDWLEIFFVSNHLLYLHTPNNVFE